MRREYRTSRNGKRVTRLVETPEEREAREAVVDAIREIQGMAPLYDRSGEHRTDRERFAP